jgi:hypothetical protein
MRIIFTIFLFVFACTANAQLLSWSPQFVRETSTPVVITLDGTKGNQALKDYLPTNVYIHIGVITTLSTGPTDWKYSRFEWGVTTNPAAKATPIGGNKWTYTITGGLRNFFGITNPNEKILKIALLFRSGDGGRVHRNTDGSDMYIPVYEAGANAIQFTQPPIVPTNTISNEQINANVGTTVPVTAVASASDGILNLYFNGSKIAGPVSGTNTISGSAAATSAGMQEFIAEYLVGGISYYDTVNYFITPSNTIAALPAGVQEGINYNAGCTSATLVLYAPNKANVIVVGDFPGSDWALNTNFLMNKTPDANYYWITINNLVPGVEYAFNYVVDGSIYVADPYTEKVLDPYNDPFIPAATYPNLKPYPNNPNVTAGKNGIMSILQTCAPEYNWKVNNFTKPDKRNLIIYELLVRDFGAAKNYQMLIDTINYFKRLGINAIELMPINEFAGNESWGYNPTFYAALDKAYGTKENSKSLLTCVIKTGLPLFWM